MAQRAISVLLSVGLLAQSLGCQTDEDCSLNGVCDTSAGSDRNSSSPSCICDPGWRGSDCNVLDIRPAKRDAGYNRTAEGISSWGSSIVHDKHDDGLFHLFLAEFENACGLEYWSPYSRIIRAESRTGPEGPYESRDEVVGTFSHNPTVVWSEADQEYLLYYIGCPQVVSDTCTSPNFTCGPGNYLNGESGISVASSVDLSRWTSHGPVFLGENSTAWDAVVTNPSPFPLYSPEDQTGEILLAYRGCPVNCDAGWERINIASSSDFLGPYEELSPDPLFMDSNEDPFIWQDKRGNWHMLLHSLEPTGGFGDGPDVGRHAFARRWEGPWTFVSETLVYNTTIEYDDGSDITFYRRERPQLFFSEDGEMTPLFLTNGVQPMNSSMSYTAIVPVGDAGQAGRL